MSCQQGPPLRGLLLLGLGWLAGFSPAAAQTVRPSDSLWVSTDPLLGEPKLGAISLAEGATLVLHVWLRVDAEAEFDVGGFYLPLFLDQPGETRVQVGLAGGSRSPATSAFVPGTAVDGSLSLEPPFSTWPVRALYEKSYPAASDTMDLLVAATQSVTPGSGWNGRALVGSFSLTGVTVGSTTIALASHPLVGGAWAPPVLTNPGGTNTWLPTFVPVEVTVTSATSSPPSGTPAQFALYALLPPATGGTASVQFELPQPSLVTIALYDSRGRRLLEVASDVPYPAGRHTRGADLSRFGKGVYYYQLVARDPASRAELFRGSESYAHVR